VPLIYAKGHIVLNLLSEHTDAHTTDRLFYTATKATNSLTTALAYITV